MAEPLGTKAWPVEIRLKKEQRRLEIDFEDGASFSLPAELLRVESPSAEVKGHTPSQKTLVAGKRHVGIRSVEPVGNYALRILFDDGHDTGLFSWRYLYELGREIEPRMAAYVAELEKRGLKRE
jgi:DUF971 family protein